MTEREKIYQAIVIGGGHAGVESALALARNNKKTLLMTLSLDAISFMACNPAIGGTAKGQLVREIDALGGQMGIAADKNLLQIRRLNTGKGEAVRSLRGQADKTMYHLYMKRVLEQEENLTVLQAEASEVLTQNDKVIGVKTSLGDTYYCDTVIVASGVYLNAEIIIGEFRQKVGPSGFAKASFLTDSLLKLGHSMRRFKTGTPARVHKKSIDFSKMEIQNGEDKIYPFSFMTDGYIENTHPCYLTYTTELTKKIIMDNIHRSPLYNGSIHSVGPRYCPSIEDKIMKFADKERHQLFVEPESAFTDEMYVQGMSSSLPFDVQEKMYKSVIGLENVKIMRYAYAIEYDCIDSLSLFPSLMSKHIQGLFMAGQINGSSGYEEAAAQGLIAGINANNYIENREPLVLGRNQAYIGVLIDDLVTKGTNEPYRMMTARAEYRINLREENADLRLTQIGREQGLVKDDRYTKFIERQNTINKIKHFVNKTSISPKVYGELFNEKGESISDRGLTYADMLKRANITAEDLHNFFPDCAEFPIREFTEVAVLAKYEGYMAKQDMNIQESKKLEEVKLPEDIDYMEIQGLRLEARQKLNKIRPFNLGQASRISGVSPADINVLIVYLKMKKKS